MQEPLADPPAAAPVRTPTVDETAFRHLYRKSEHLAQTSDGWTLVLTRYQPVPQPFPQPLLHEPLLLVHGFSQNRHAWTSGEFVKTLLYFGLDVHILELRGHGKSSVALQRKTAQEQGRPPPSDVDYGWNLDSFLLEDLPAAVAAVKRVTGREKIFYCGHSMGGILGYGYAGLHPDLEGIITIGSPSDLGRGFLLLKLASIVLPPLGPAVDVAFASINAQRRLTHRGRHVVAGAAGRLSARLATRLRPGDPTRALRFRYVPVDAALKVLEGLLAHADRHPLYEELLRRLNWLSNHRRVRASDIRWLLREGGERETRGVMEQFARWIRRGELRCYRTGYDFREGFGRIKVPLAIIFGDMDPLATVESTRRIYEEAQSEYLLWRPVKGNSHIELTMGHDIRQICYDIKNLIEYAVIHRARPANVPPA